MGTSTKGMRPAPMGAGYPAPGDPTGYSDRMSHAAADHPGMSARRLPAVEERSAGGVVVEHAFPARDHGGGDAVAHDVHGRAAHVHDGVDAKDQRDPFEGQVVAGKGGRENHQETLPQTAAREVAEETGIEGKVLIELGTIDYWFAAGERRIHKYVHHYLLEATGGHLTIENDPDHEAIDVAWLPLRDAHRHLTFPNERRIARLAWQRLSGDAASC